MMKEYFRKYEYLMFDNRLKVYLEKHYSKLAKGYEVIGYDNLTKAFYNHVRYDFKSKVEETNWYLNLLESDKKDADKLKTIHGHYMKYVNKLCDDLNISSLKEKKERVND